MMKTSWKHFTGSSDQYNKRNTDWKGRGKTIYQNMQEKNEKINIHSIFEYNSNRSQIQSNNWHQK